ncbi:uncharacterized protein AlacWU_03743 [Aspergillus niger]|uniref:uncharacterized protein n=1 Tax=Aspergillus lacticoffeatus (strain CBS 101883) TaxID=1450533 RepID=UPI000D7F396D|nr:uncharacterized protein BO96DRAFT_502131 [Aspergillus niger CBS 101883]PYH54583.1 hypothetical protein BO96DRAFT_502131 [Aspergillus niger CBS 101883]GJP90844.1 uncharacterized protein AlacWU_03743 [Aspergillus niger]
MSTIFQDRSLLDPFKREAFGKPTLLTPHTFTVDVLDSVQAPDGCYQLIPRKVTVPELEQLPVPVLRIIFSPLDVPSSVTAEGFLWLFDHYAAPSAFLAGRLRSVTHSFGALNSINGYNCSWFHYLCKNITVTHDAHGNAQISDPRPGAPQMQHGDSTWIRSGYFLRWAVSSNRGPEVTLLCFEASKSLKERLKDISPSSIPTNVVRDPYSLFAIILEELSLQMDNTKTLTTMKDRESFTGLLNVSEHILFLQESAEAAILTLKKLSWHHQQIMEDVPDGDRHATEMAQGMLMHAETQFQSISLRLKGLEKRMDNIIALSFHLVTQDGNRIMQADSSSMTTIVFVTLVFLPVSTVSTIFGNQFFNFDPETIRISQSFWIFWVVSIPLTFLVLLVWRVLTKGLPPEIVRCIYYEEGEGESAIAIFDLKALLIYQCIGPQSIPGSENQAHGIILFNYCNVINPKPNYHTFTLLLHELQKETDQSD